MAYYDTATDSKHLLDGLFEQADSKNVTNDDLHKLFSAVMAQPKLVGWRTDLLTETIYDITTVETMLLFSQMYRHCFRDSLSKVRDVFINQALKISKEKNSASLINCLIADWGLDSTDFSVEYLKECLEDHMVDDNGMIIYDSAKEVSILLVPILLKDREKACDLLERVRVAFNTSGGCSFCDDDRRRDAYGPSESESDDE
jgi:hypothetical protein